jgi:thiol-disulfide isomerase/thioredoxin
MVQISRRESLFGFLAAGVAATGIAVVGARPAHASGLGRADLWKTMKLVRHDGTKFTLADRPSRVVVAAIWVSFCQPCLAELPQLRRLPQLLGADNVDVVLISHPDEWASDYPVAVRNGLGAQAATIDRSVSRQTVAAAFSLQDGALDLPQSFAFARPDMRTVHSALGPVNWANADMVGRLRQAALA